MQEEYLRMTSGIGPTEFAVKVDTWQSSQISAEFAGVAGRLFQHQLDLADEQSLLKLWAQCGVRDKNSTILEKFTGFAGLCFQRLNMRNSY